ncbi:endonuclease/exonuclease/phosphatase family protein [Carboxylicivirga mesophila]|uniref:Endonuclease/exonuclease/phosphatase family protein n=1 Tax=Carboxylicivirga mesophila TaxID=1166478 RepID=A0ABS5KGT2_9BACT|nr:endonuclease/exonuclease/phosphatase family protein [Carboxylicivirga mesophila]MBS2213638.1 endonuclease/exonuclease/phosphatase family protein [Carboxylicivirga mesophila]
MKSTLLLIILYLLTNIISLAQNSEDSTNIKVLSFNILHGATTQNTFDLDAIAQVIIDADPDFVALQEVDYKTNRAHQYDLATELGWRSKLLPLFGRAMYFDGGEYGVAILSKHTLIASENIALPTKAGDEPRTALSVTSILPGNDTIEFIATHLDHLKDGASRLLQAQQLQNVSTKINHPAILAGDLNATPGSPAINLLEEHWLSSYEHDNPHPTYPSHQPEVKIDYVMMKPASRWQVVQREVIADTIVSDHCAYLVSLKLLKD